MEQFYKDWFFIGLIIAALADALLALAGVTFIAKRWRRSETTDADNHQ